MKQLIKTITKDIQEKTSNEFSSIKITDIQGGCINQGLKITDKKNQSYFVKLNTAQNLEMFKAEYEGLNELKKSESFIIPSPICVGKAKTQAYIVIEYIDFYSAKPQSMAKAGQQLAKMHQYTNKNYGWYRSNTIGTTPQINKVTNNWLIFWQEQRLNYQIHLLKNKVSSQLIDKIYRLIEKLPLILNHNPVPSLLHGDLWGGNISFNQEGEPVIFDPAVYYGDREADIAMTELFGGFNHQFYQAYNEVWALDKAYQQRKNVYNLYHILNHFYIFGGSYANQAEKMIDRL